MSNKIQNRRQLIAKTKQSLSKIPIISRNVSAINQKLHHIQLHLHDQDDIRSVSCITLDKVESTEMVNIDTFNQKYRLCRKIGQGSSGIVRECLHLKKNKIYACKTMMFDDQHVPLLKRNFTDVRELNHINIVKYKALYLDLEKHLAYLVMQYVAWESLMDYITELTKPIQENSIKWIFQELFKTLEYMHSKGVSHRDIKPDNIMIDPITKKIKIIDFGIAKKFINRKQKSDMLTITGTLFYRAPQMFIGGGYNQKVDIWGAGVTLFEIMYGKTPFQSQYHSQTIQNIQNVELENQVLNRQENNQQECSEILKDLLCRIMRKDPKERLSAKDALNHLWFEKRHFKLHARYSDVGHIVETQHFKLHARYSDVGHIVETQYSKCIKKNVEYDPRAFKQCKNSPLIRKNNSPTYHRLEVDDI